MDKIEGSSGKLELIAIRSFKPYGDMYKIVDFLNKELKHKNIMFGLAKGDDGDSMRISIYQT